VHCTGYLKSWAPAKIGVHDQDAEGDVEACNLSCLVRRLIQITIFILLIMCFLWFKGGSWAGPTVKFKKLQIEGNVRQRKCG
jgi:hypothetical protein